ncbi:MAG: hypothetical protein EOP06_17885 [Proteobacteria bacterium]|nr:MAG: hypothetical protein EOP06_17885 [Pseudomonadota bacterium]
MKYNKLTRRMFLEGAGKTALAIPFLSSLMTSEAKAATVSKKFVSIQSDYFIARELATPGYYDAPGKIPWTQVDGDQKYQLLSDYVKVNGKISQIFDQSWNPYADKINIITNSNAYIQSFLHNATISGERTTNTIRLGARSMAKPKGCKMLRTSPNSKRC